MNHVLVATYGTLRQGCSNHEYYLNDDGVQFLGNTHTDPVYTLFDLGSYPAVLEGGKTAVRVEVYEVTPEVKERLDHLEGYEEGREGNLYDTTTIKTPYGEAVMYVMPHERYKALAKNCPVIQSGDWKAYKRKK